MLTRCRLALSLSKRRTATPKPTQRLHSRPGHSASGRVKSTRCASRRTSTETTQSELGRPHDRPSSSLGEMCPFNKLAARASLDASNSIGAIELRIEFDARSRQPHSQCRDCATGKGVLGTRARKRLVAGDSVGRSLAPLCMTRTTPVKVRPNHLIRLQCGAVLCYWRVLASAPETPAVAMRPPVRGIASCGAHENPLAVPSDASHVFYLV